MVKIVRLLLKLVTTSSPKFSEFTSKQGFLVCTQALFSPDFTAFLTPDLR